jgi:hypothetical protein
MNENINHTWQVGQRAVCVSELFPSEATKVCDTLPIGGSIYTIRAIRQTSFGIALLLKEIVNTREIYGKEPGFWQHHFEPLVD